MLTLPVISRKDYVWNYRGVTYLLTVIHTSCALTITVICTPYTATCTVHVQYPLLWDEANFAKKATTFHYCILLL